MDLGQTSAGYPHTIIRIDGSWESGPSFGSSAWIATTVVGGASYFHGRCGFAHTALQTEILACHLALSWASARGLTHILIMTESALLVQLLRSVTIRDISVLHLLTQIREMGATFSWCRIIKVSRRAVSQAHDLAHIVRISPNSYALL